MLLGSLRMLLWLLWSRLAVSAASPELGVSVSHKDGSYTISLDGHVWLQSSAPSVCMAGNTSVALIYKGISFVNGTDLFGTWSGPAVTWQAVTSGPAIRFNHTFKQYANRPSVVVLTATFTDGLDTSACGSNAQQSTRFPVFDTGAAQAPSLSFVSWRGTALSNTLAVRGLATLAQAGLDAGPVIASDTKGTSLMWSTLDSHKIVVQATLPGSGAMGPLVSMWSAERLDQIACLSAACFQDQVVAGNYDHQRTEGYALLTSESQNVWLNGKNYATIPLVFAWSAVHADNFVGNSSSPRPDTTYSFSGPNGAIFADHSAPGSVALYAVSRQYSETHTDWATVASAAGLAWARSNNYTVRGVLGYVLADPPANTSSIYSMGLSAAIPSIPPGWNYSVMFSAAYGGITAASYVWGAAIQAYYETKRQPSVTLSHLGYYTDDGAYYYVWEAFNCCNQNGTRRPWPAEEGLVLVKEALWDRGVPVAYMQLDDWWYNGPFYFGNVKAVVDWHASNSSRLFPSGPNGTLSAFQANLGLPLQLYTPFWSDAFDSRGFNMTESTVFKGTKLVTPDDSLAFFTYWFEFGAELTGGAKNFAAFEVDFLDANFQGSASMFESVEAADKWYGGMAVAAAQVGIVIQYCLPSATDMLQSLAYPNVVQARASGDYVNTVQNAYQLGGSSLLMGATAMAPSKDTLWTASPQPPTYSDIIRNGNYTTQPHVALDCVLATLSLGPVGISDGINQTDVNLISQAFRSPTDSTLLRPNRPLSWVDSVFFNQSFTLGPALDVRSTHSAVPLAPGSIGNTLITHYVVAWRTATPATLGLTDLYPAPPADMWSRLAIRPHIAAPAGAAQYAGCVDGLPAIPTCITLAGLTGVTIPATGSDVGSYSLTAVYSPMSNGAYFLGELTKFVHVAPQRFDYVRVAPSGQGGKAGLLIGLRGSAGQVLQLTAVDAAGMVRTTSLTLPSSGVAENVPL